MKILIVDDEKISRTILGAKLKKLGDCVAVNSSRKALALLQDAEKGAGKFDLITLDVSMPGMDGRQMLRHIRKKEIENKIPKEDRIKICMVSARMNLSTIKECIRLGCNSYLVKPVTRNQLIQAFEKMGIATREKMIKNAEDNTEQTAAVADVLNLFYAGKIELPVFPHVVQEVQALLGREESPTMEELAKIVNQDITVASKLISIANSPLYRGVEQVDTLGAALLRLGFKTTRGVVSAVAAKNMFNAGNESLGKELDRLWMHSFATGSLARQIAKVVENKNPENLFLMGIIHDIGKMLLMKAYVDMYPEFPLSDRQFQLAVHEIHTTFGAALLKKMRFPASFIHAAEFHHWNTFGRDTEQELLVLNLADHLSYEIGFGYLPELAPDHQQENAEGKTAFAQKARIAQRQRDEDEGIDAGATMGLREREAATARLSRLPSLNLLGISAEQVLALGEEISPMVRESARAF